MSSRSWTASTSTSATAATWWINLRLTPKLLRVSLAASDAPPARIGVKGVVVEIRPGTSHEFRLS